VTAYSFKKRLWQEGPQGDTMAIELTPVSSSNVAAIGFDPETKQLHVRYKSGGTYVYHDVPAEKHEALMKAESKGKHLAEHIKGKHSHAKG
jgi:hypothetical protein